jgi:HlyD family secretion protein
MNRKKIIVLVVAIVAAVFAIRAVRQKSARAGDTIRVSGNIEATDVEVSFRTAGRVQERAVAEGQRVQTGDVVALLEGTELRQLADQAGAAVAVAKAEAERARLEYARQDELFQKRVVSKRDYELAVASRDMAEARAREAEAGLALAKTRLDYATLKAPVSGVVLAEHIEAGEYVVPGTPVVTLGDLQNTRLRAYINETDLGRVKVGQAVRVRTDTYPEKTYPGRVSFVASEAEFTPRAVQTQKERVKLVYRIKVDVPNLAMELKPGMPADADIAVK